MEFRWKILTVLVVLRCSQADAELHPNYGRFEIRNSMNSTTPDSVFVHCKRPLLDLPEVQMYPGDLYLHDFYADERVIQGWTCNFYWYDGNSKNMKRSQEFLVWNKNGTSPYLDGRDRCRWRVRESGFFLQSHREESKAWTLLFHWNEFK